MKKKLKIKYEYVDTPEGKRRLEEFYNMIFERAYQRLFKEYKEKQKVKLLLDNQL